MKHYAVNLVNGTVGIVQSKKGLETVRRAVLREEGAANIQSIDEATPENVAWFEMMGGKIWEV